VALKWVSQGGGEVWLSVPQTNGGWWFYTTATNGDIVQVVREDYPVVVELDKESLDVSVLPREDRTEGLTPLILHMMANSTAST